MTVRDPNLDIVAWARLLVARYATLFDAGRAAVRGTMPAELQRWIDGAGPPPERQARARALGEEIAAYRALPATWLESHTSHRAGSLFSALPTCDLERDLLALLVGFDVSPGIAAAVRTLSAWPEASGVERSFAQAVIDPFGEAQTATAELLRAGHPLVAAGIVRGLESTELGRARFLELAPTVLTWLFEGPRVACERQRGIAWVWAQDDTVTQRAEAIRVFDEAALGKLLRRLSERWRLRVVASTADDVAVAVRLVALRIGLPIVAVDCRVRNDPRRGLVGEQEAGQLVLERLRVAATVASLDRAILLVSGLDSDGGDGAREGAATQPLAGITEVCHRLKTPLVLADTSARDAPGATAQLAKSLALPSHDLSFPDKDERQALWSRALAAHGRGLERTLSLGRLAAFPLSGAQIASLTERSVTRSEAGEWDDVCREAVGHRVGDLAQHVRSKAIWDEVILPEAVAEVVDDILVHARHRHKVMVEWGLGAKHAYGLGLSALFSGPPGTGKTLLAGLIARELDLDLYRIDLSRVVSKYIGETEQRLARLFDEARRGGVALLFDEADSLFAKRTDVKSSVDRYANLEVNFLLQRMEDYDGVVMLTTNLPDSLDEAFRRRIRFHARFPMPDVTERERLWRALVPKNAPLKAGLPFHAIAKAYEFSGGEIKNAALRAAFYAADDGGVIGLEHIERASQAECRERGRLVLKTARDFL